MNSKRLVMVAVLGVLLLFAGFGPGFAQKKSTDPVPLPEAQKARLGSLSGIGVIPGYTPVSLWTGLSSPRGLGVIKPNKVLVNTEDYKLWLYSGGNLTQVLTSPTMLFASRYKGAYYVGDINGNIFKLKNNVLNLLASLGSGYIAGLDVDSNGDIYFHENQNHVLYKLKKGSHTPTVLATTGISSWGVAVKGKILYFSDAYNGKIWSMPKKGGALTLLVSGLSTPTDIIADKKGNLYVAVQSSGSIAVIPKGTTTINYIGSGFAAPYYLGLDSKGNVYFSDFGTGTLWMLKKV